MDINTLQWDKEICLELDVPVDALPEIRPSAGSFGNGHPSGPLPDVPLSGVLGDQSAALFGQGCFDPGDIKCTYGTGNFVLMNAGSAPLHSGRGLISTVAHQAVGEPAATRWKVRSPSRDRWSSGSATRSA
jgi:glycerol kinase